jgi:hypothetical protein
MNVSLRLGETFNPYRMFTGLFIPEGLARSDRISAGAKLAWVGWRDTQARMGDAIRT